MLVKAHKHPGFKYPAFGWPLRRIWPKSILSYT